MDNYFFIIKVSFEKQYLHFIIVRVSYNLYQYRGHVLNEMLVKLTLVVIKTIPKNMEITNNPTI